MRLFMRCVCCGVVAFWCVSCAPFTVLVSLALNAQENSEESGPDLPAVVMEVSGTAQFRRAGEQTWRTLEMGSRIGTGIEVRTGKGGAATIAFQDNASKIHVSENSQLLLQSVIVSGSKVDAVIHVIAGAVSGTFTSVNEVSTFKIVPPEGEPMEYRPNPGSKMEFSMALGGSFLKSFPSAGTSAASLSAFSDPFGTAPRTSASGDPASTFRGDLRAIPEPTSLSLALIALGCVGIGWACKWRH